MTENDRENRGTMLDTSFNERVLDLNPLRESEKPENQSIHEPDTDASLDLRRLQKVIEHAPGAAIQCIDRDGMVRMWNKTTTTLFGFKKTDTLGKRLKMILFPHSRAGEFEKAFQKVLKTQRTSKANHWLAQTQSGEKLWVHGALIPFMENGQVSEVFCFLYDATDARKAEKVLLNFRHELEKRIQERTNQLTWVSKKLQEEILVRQRAEAALKDSEQKFRIFAQNSYEWEYWIAPNGAIIYLSPSCERITGYGAGRFHKDPDLIERIVHPEDRDGLRSELKQHILEKRDLETTFRIITHNKTVRVISHVNRAVFGGLDEYLGRRISNRDITERKMAEAGLHQAHAELEGRVAKRTRALKRVAEALQRKQRELISQQTELEAVNTRLLETNKAVSILAGSIEKKKAEVEKKISLAISSKILPLLNELQQESLQPRIEAQLHVVAMYLTDLTIDSQATADLVANLTTNEIKIASMIKAGLTTPKIASQLNLSPLTVKTHRKNIRKKLGLKNKSTNLLSYLQTKIT
ncbi:MAG: PAS domain S-box protein [Deltaproteobacteria bacterium]|nr:PAS domain S-box protein [Deltaproteobacteria bacterium]